MEILLLFVFCYNGVFFGAFLVDAVYFLLEGRTPVLDRIEKWVRKP
jgi:hypothetical protein